MKLPVEEYRAKTAGSSYLDYKRAHFPKWAYEVYRKLAPLVSKAGGINISVSPEGVEYDPGDGSRNTIQIALLEFGRVALTVSGLRFEEHPVLNEGDDPAGWAKQIASRLPTLSISKEEEQERAIEQAVAQLKKSWDGGAHSINYLPHKKRLQANFDVFDSRRRADELYEDDEEKYERLFGQEANRATNDVRKVLRNYPILKWEMRWEYDPYDRSYGFVTVVFR